ncbi:MAG: SMP-30/gluconolactonase/LRE family protein [Planctomycetaceae bacterium]
MNRLHCAALVILATAVLASPVPALAQDAIAELFHPDSKWELVGEGYKFTEGPAVDRAGNVFFSDPADSKIHKAAVDGKVTLFDENTGNTNGLMFGPDGKLYGCRNADKQIVAYDPDGKRHVVAEGAGSNDIVVSSKGHIWFTDRNEQMPKQSHLQHVSPEGKMRSVATGWRPNGVILLPDEKTLVATNSDAPQLHAFKVAEDGSLTPDGFYKPLKTPPNRGVAGSDGMTVDDEGRLYLASYVGLQVYGPDRAFMGIIEKPENKFLSNVVFGGPEFDYLYVTLADKVYRRKMSVKGTPYFLRGATK